MREEKPAAVWLASVFAFVQPQLLECHFSSWECLFNRNSNINISWEVQYEENFIHSSFGRVQESGHQSSRVSSSVDNLNHLIKQLVAWFMNPPVPTLPPEESTQFCRGFAERKLLMSKSCNIFFLPRSRKTFSPSQRLKHFFSATYFSVQQNLDKF